LYWYKCITTIVDWLNMIFYWLLRHSDGTHVNEPSKDKSMDGVNVDDISGMFNKKLTIDDKVVMHLYQYKHLLIVFEKKSDLK
jgi:hypothetical protein